MYRIYTSTGRICWLGAKNAIIPFSPGHPTFISQCPVKSSQVVLERDPTICTFPISTSLLLTSCLMGAPHSQGWLCFKPDLPHQPTFQSLPLPPLLMSSWEDATRSKKAAEWQLWQKGTTKADMKIIPIGPSCCVWSHEMEFVDPKRGPSRKTLRSRKKRITIHLVSESSNPKWLAPSGSYLDTMGRL